MDYSIREFSKVTGLGIHNKHNSHSEKSLPVIRYANPGIAREISTGSYNVINGQHRIEAMRKMNGGDDVMVPCLVFTGCWA